MRDDTIDHAFNATIESCTERAIVSAMLRASLSRYVLALSPICLPCCAFLSGLQTTPPQQISIQARSPTFEIVSIHRSKPDSNQSVNWGIAPDGYHAEGQSLWDTLMVAYFPEGMGYWSSKRLINAPSWLDEQYDINAKVAESDIASWQAQGPTLDRKPMLQHMLQSMLIDRCHLLAHLEPGPDLPGYALLLSKGGSHLKVTVSGEALPDAVSLGEGGVLVPWRRDGTKQLRFYNTSMAEFARWFSHHGPLQDATHLTGRYDFILNAVENPDPVAPAGAAQPESHDPFANWDLAALGLQLKPAKFPVSRLVIEHMDRPSPN